MGVWEPSGGGSPITGCGDVPPRGGYQRRGAPQGGQKLSGPAGQTEAEMAGQRPCMGRCGGGHNRTALDHDDDAVGIENGKLKIENYAHFQLSIFNCQFDILPWFVVL